MRIPAVFAVLVTVCGCVSPGTYPHSWPGQIRTGNGGCPVVDGEYWNVDEYFEKSRHGLERHSAILIHDLRPELIVPERGDRDRPVSEWKAPPYRKIGVRKTGQSLLIPRGMRTAAQRPTP